MQRAVITAKGDVQRVGYRDTVQKTARDLEITGCVQNIEPYDVRMIAEGSKKRLKQFIEAIKIERYPIFVKELAVEWGDATGEFEYFKIIRGDWREELFERFDVAGALLYRSVELGEENIAIGRKMIEKQDVVIEEVRGVRYDLKSYMENRFERIDGEMAEIKQALRQRGII